jgi:hypothetical protein
MMKGLAPKAKGLAERVEYTSLVEPISIEWRPEWGSKSTELSEQGMDEAAEEKRIPFSVCQGVQRLVDGHRAATLRSAELTSFFFQTFFADEDISAELVGSWKNARKWFEAVAAPVCGVGFGIL